MGNRGDALNGRWKSDWGAATLDVEGDTLTGTWAEGGLEGTVADDGTVRLGWSHRDGTKGRATLKASADDAALTGTWGFGDSDSDGGAWALSQVERVSKAPPAKAEEPAPPPAEPPGEAPPGDAPSEKPAEEGGKKGKK